MLLRCCKALATGLFFAMSATRGRAMFYNSNWIHSFPQNYQWPNAILVTKGMAPYGAAAMGEIDIVTQKLHGRINEPHAWGEETSARAQFVERAGDAAAAAGNHATPGNYHLPAATYH